MYNRYYLPIVSPLGPPLPLVKKSRILDLQKQLLIKCIGLYPEGHQIVDNHMMDRETGEVFDLYNDTTSGNAKWWGGHVPIWTTLTHQGYRVGLHHWSRCDVEFKIEGRPVWPKKCDPYSDHTNEGEVGNGYTDNLQVLKDALDQSVLDLVNDELDVSFVYYPTIDTKGHRYGPEGQELREEIQGVDLLLYGFLLNLQSHNLADKTNVIIVADHGMTANKNFLHESLSDYMSQETVDNIEKIVAGNNIILKDPTKVDEAVADLKTWDELKVFKKGELPAYYGLKKAQYVEDVIILPKAKVIWGVDNTNPDKYEPPAGPSDDTEEAQQQGGNHGYEDITNGYGSEGDNPDMRSIFMAIGPSFKVNREHEWIKQVDEYQVMKYALKVENGPAHNGTWDRVKCMFQDVDCGEGNTGNGVTLISPFMPLVVVLGATIWN